MSYYQQLILFLAQAKTDDLTRKRYKKEYLGTDVNVSFGVGNQAKVPWISFLIEPNKTQNGIYPVYLYYKKLERLILAYGVSATNEPDLEWNLDKLISVERHFINNYREKPVRYGESFVFKDYDVNHLPSPEEIDADLSEIIRQYKEIMGKADIISKLPVGNQDETNLFSNKKVEESFNPTISDHFTSYLENSGLTYSPTLLTRFVASLLTKPFVILTGLSGSGKTKLAQTFVQWICQNKNQYGLVPVGADWTNREPLLGYPNALIPGKYEKPDSGVLDLILHANENKDLPHFLILDEMNLSIVERYFADFLSAMESGEGILLYSGDDIQNGVPKKLTLPSNLFIIGTVNIDETTHMFSPKVLDRANTIEFRITEDEMAGFLDNVKETDTETLKGKGAGMAEDFLILAMESHPDVPNSGSIKKDLLSFFKELKKVGAEFGYRSAGEIFRLIYKLGLLDKNMSPDEKLDIAIMQKLLPKLHGSRRKLVPVLETLGSICISGEINIISEVFEKDDFDFKGTGVKYPLSLEKITRMYKGAVDNGFASFAEA